jgi:hypothetical protein
MKVLFILLMLFSTSSFAQRKLTAHVFQANVKPVLTGILSDFYQMVSLFPEFPRELPSIVDQIDNLTEARETLKVKCPRLLNKACLDEVNGLRQRIRQTQAKTLKLISDQRMSANLHLNSLTGLRLMNEFHAHLEEAKVELDNLSLMVVASVPHRKETYGIIKRMDQLQTYISLAVVEYIPYEYKDDFRHFYANFVHPIQIQISKHQNYEFLNRNVNSLNFAINLLNMNLTKRNKKTPEGMAPYLSLIHNRWNSLLRYYM